MKTDDQLKLALAKMLPEKIKQGELHLKYFFWKDDNGISIVRETEWLHVCWLIEQSLTWEELTETNEVLAIEILKPDERIFHASWQQRAEALCKVKGIEI